MNEQVTPKKRGLPLGVKNRSPEHKQALADLKEALEDIKSVKNMQHILVVEYAELLKTREVKRTLFQRLVYLFKGA